MTVGLGRRLAHAVDPHFVGPLAGCSRRRPKGGLLPLRGVARGIRGAPLRARDTGRLRKAGPPRTL